MDQPVGSLKTRDARAYEDRGNDGESGAALRYLRAQRESEAERQRSQGIPEVVDQVSKKGDAAAGDEHARLSQRCHAENGERE